MLLALSLLTVLPVPGRPELADPRAAGRAMLWAPAVGAVLGLLVVLVAEGATSLGLQPALAGLAVVAALAVLTRALHLDGLADTADGLGSARPAQQALDVMRRSDIGPFGVVTLVLVLLAQVSAAGTLVAAGSPWLLLLLPVTGRLALPLVCRRGVPPARRDGLGAAVAGTVPLVPAAAVTAGVLVAAAGLASRSGTAVWSGPLAVVLGLVAAEVLLRRCHRRLGGVTGDVLGAVVVTAETAAVVVLAAAA